MCGLDEAEKHKSLFKRELTKKFEEVKKAPASELLGAFSRAKPKGEFVILMNLSDKKH